MIADGPAVAGSGCRIDVSGRTPGTRPGGCAPPSSRLADQRQAQAGNFLIGAHQKQIAAECRWIPGFAGKNAKAGEFVRRFGGRRAEDDFAVFGGHMEQVVDEQNRPMAVATFLPFGAAVARVDAGEVPSSRP